MNFKASSQNCVIASSLEELILGGPSCEKDCCSFTDINVNVINYYYVKIFPDSWDNSIEQNNENCIFITFKSTF